MRIVCPQPCPICGERSFLDVDDELAARIVAWANDPRPLIQQAVPELTAVEREQLITGTHAACWDALFADTEED